MSSPGPVFYIHVECRRCRGEVRLNDAPIIELSLDHARDVFPTVSQWVVNGDNALSVRVLEIEAGARIRVSLCQATLGDVPEPGNELELAVIEWPPAIAEPLAEGVEVPAVPELPVPTVLRAVGMVRHPWGDWSWQTAPSFATDAGTTQAVIAWVRDLHANLAAGRIDVFTAVSQIKVDEFRRAYALADEDVDKMPEVWAYLTSRPGWELAELDEADLDLRLHCDSRLVEPRTRDGQPVIRQAREIGGEQWSMPIFIARTNYEYVAGRLTIVR